MRTPSKNPPHRPIGTKKIKTPEKLMELFNDYTVEIKANPFKVKDWVGKDAHMVIREKERPLTMEGFSVYVFKTGIIANIWQYFSNYKGNYESYIEVCARIREVIKADQIEGGAAMIYNASIVQRLNGLVEKAETKIDLVEHTVTLDLK
jgi:hypothetical protein